MDQIPAAKLDVDHRLTDEEDEDFEEESDGDDTAALPAELEKNLQSSLQSQSGRAGESLGVSCHPGHIPPCKMPAWSLVPSLGSASSLGLPGDSGAGRISASHGGHPTAVTIGGRRGLQAWWGGAWG